MSACATYSHTILAKIQTNLTAWVCNKSALYAALLNNSGLRTWNLSVRLY
jgi:hypothetical protein